MWFSRRKLRVSAEAFIADQVQSSLTQRVDDMSKLLASAEVGVKDEIELTMFSAFLPLLAMVLARIDENVQRGYLASVASEFEQRFGEDVGNLFQERVLAYLAAFDEDMGKPFFPKAITLVLDNVLGKSDESVVLPRLALAKVLPGLLRVDTDFYRELKFV